MIYNILLTIAVIGVAVIIWGAIYCYRDQREMRNRMRLTRESNAQRKTS